MTTGLHPTKHESSSFDRYIAVHDVDDESSQGIPLDADVVLTATLLLGYSAEEEWQPVPDPQSSARIDTVLSNILGYSVIGPSAEAVLAELVAEAAAIPADVESGSDQHGDPTDGTDLDGIRQAQLRSLHGRFEREPGEGD